MTALLPPNLLKLFAPRPHPPFLKPPSKDERNRGPNRLGGLAHLAQQIREEAEDAEVKRGIAEQPATVPEVNGNREDGEVKDELMNHDGENGEEVEGKKKKKDEKGKGKRKDKIAELGVVGQEAINMRREARKVRQEEYKKNADKNCEIPSTSFISANETD
jgi:U1 small nuclear ribonucleoprotein